MSKKIIVVGAGAAGMMAAGVAAKNGAQVTLIEKNELLGKKIRITGKGRCNITNNCSIEEFLLNIPKNGKFLYSAINQFSPQDTINFFEENGLKVKTERGNRVFPESDNAKDVVKAFESFLKNSGVKIVTEKVKKLLLENNSCIGVMLNNGEKILSDSVIIACGGKSYPGTGSTGDGYILAKSVGHEITNIKPSLVPLVAKEKFCSELTGLSLKNVSIDVIDNKKNKSIYKDFGEMLFTHFGVSGPLILSASSHIEKMEKDRYNIKIDLKPALSNEQLNKRIQRDFIKYQNKDFINSLGDLLPKKMIPIIAQLSKIPPNLKCNEITKEMRKNLVELLKGLTITIECFRPIEEAIITSGGINVKQINPKTMESKIINNLYFAGEVIDVDGYTGGFNLQIAFSTGYIAGKSSVKD